MTERLIDPERIVVPMPEQKPTHIRRTVFFRGRVQGVGFRFTTCDVARSFGVVGFVKNLPDGRVEMVAEGDPGEVSRFQEAVADAMEGRITDASGQESPATGEFSSFSIAY